LEVAAERQALPARAGIGGQNHQTPNPPLGLNPESAAERPHLSGARGVSPLFDFGQSLLIKTGTNQNSRSQKPIKHE